MQDKPAAKVRHQMPEKEGPIADLLKILFSVAFLAIAAFTALTRITTLAIT